MDLFCSLNCGHFFLLSYVLYVMFMCNIIRKSFLVRVGLIYSNSEKNGSVKNKRLCMSDVCMCKTDISFKVWLEKVLLQQFPKVSFFRAGLTRSNSAKNGLVNLNGSRLCVL